MPAFNRTYKAVLTNVKKPKAHHVVVKSKDGRMTIQKSGRPFPWPKDLVLILKGKAVAKDMIVHLDALVKEGA
jgi:hypothetical protein